MKLTTSLILNNQSNQCQFAIEVNLDDDALQKAKSQGINVFSSDMTAFGLCAEISKLI